MNRKKMNEVISLAYGYQETEEGIFHAFEANDPSNPPDCDVTAKNLAALLDTTPDDDRFNWNEMDIALPESVVREIQDDAIQQFIDIRKDTEEYARDGEEYIVELIGSDVIDNIPASSWDEAVERLTEKFNECLDNHNGGSWFDEEDIDAHEGSFTITGDEYCQRGYIIKANKAPGCLHTINEICRESDRAATYAQCYEYELQDMEGVYGCLDKICDLANSLEKTLTGKCERSYVDQLSDLTAALSTDTSMPDADKKKADLLLAQLQDLLWKYSS